MRLSTVPCIHIHVVLAAVLFILVCGDRAPAQGTQGALPDPITTPELTRYADRLGLSGEQRIAAERLHDEYREAFGRLRDTEIAGFLQSMRGMQGRMPERRAFDDFMKQWNRLWGRIAQLDDQLFMRMQEILTEQQMAMLPRVRLERERARYAGAMTMMMTGAPMIDLTHILDQMNIHPAERQAIDPALIAYEHRLTSLMRDLHKSSNSMFIDMFDAFEQAGITDDMMNDPAQMGRMMEVMQEVMQNLFARIRTSGDEMRELNDRTFRSLRPMLAPDTGRHLRNRYYSRAYPGVDFALRIPVEAKIAKALSFEIGSRLRETLEAMHFETRTRLDRILDEAVDMQRAFQQNFSPFGGPSDYDWDAHHKRFAELQTEARDLDKSMSERLSVLLAQEVDQETQQVIAEAEHETSDELRPFARFGGMGARIASATLEEETDGPQPSQLDPHLPGPISRADLTIYARLLHLDDDRRALLDELHGGYLERFKAVTEARLKSLSEARGDLWSAYADAQQGARNGDVFDRLAQLRREAHEAIRNVDAEFFAELAAVLSEDEMPRLERARLARERDSHSHLGNSTMFIPGVRTNALGRLNLSRIVRLHTMTDEDLDRLDAMLLDYDRKASDIVKAQYEAAVELQNVSDRWSIEMARAQRAGDHSMERAMQYQQVIADPQRDLVETSKRMTQLNEATIAKLTAALSKERGAALLAAFNRRAFPSIYNDSAEMTDHIRAAMRLPDLAEQQRDQLAELFAQYRTTYTSLTEQMVEISRQISPPGAFGDYQPEDWQQHMDLTEQMGKLRFERGELNARAISQVKAILSDAQLAQLSPLPEPTEQTSDIWGF